MRPVSQGHHDHMGNSRWERRCLPPAVADEIRLTRQGMGLSLRQVAQFAAISPGYLSRLERAERCPRTPVALRLIEALDLDDELAVELYQACAAPSFDRGRTDYDLDGGADGTLVSSARGEAARR